MKVNPTQIALLREERKRKKNEPAKRLVSNVTDSVIALAQAYQGLCKEVDQLWHVIEKQDKLIKKLHTKERERITWHNRRYDRKPEERLGELLELSVRTSRVLVENKITSVRGVIELLKDPNINGFGPKSRRELAEVLGFPFPLPE